MYYAQRNEDKRLRELLGEKDPGFYIDIGAWHPETDSVTKHFYDRGWKGINVEPIPDYFNLIAEARPRDVNLECACGEENRLIEITQLAGSGLSTVVQAHAKSGEAMGFKATKLWVPQLSLASIAKNYVPAGIEVDFLKIDVEGYERAVLGGNNWETLRPRFIVIEATIPCTDTPNWEAWDFIVIAAGYDFIVFDGLNRWYERA